MNNTETESKIKNKKNKRRKKKHRVLKAILLIFFILILAAAAGVFAFNKYAENVIEESAIKDIDTQDIYSLIYQKSTIYDDVGNEIDALYLSGGNRTIIAYEDIPQDLVNAVIDTEDKTFWEHKGFNYTRMIGAV